MKFLRSIGKQFNDLIVYVALPLVSIVVPSRWSRALLARGSNFEFLLSSEAQSAWSGATGLLDAGNEKDWKKRWKQVEMLDVRDMYMMSFGRTRSVLDEIECPPALDIVKDKVLIGMHWGPSIAILKLLQVAGLKPALPYRRPPGELFRVRPFYYFYQLLATRHIIKTMGERAVQVGGSGKRLREMMNQPGSVIVVMDAPAKQGRVTLNASVLDKEATFDAGFPAILTESGKEYVFYAISLQPGGLVKKQLELMGPFSSHDAMEFIQSYAGILDRYLRSDSAQWRIWQAAQQFWK